jgi:hypothetical protein
MMTRDDDEEKTAKVKRCFNEGENWQRFIN